MWHWLITRFDPGELFRPIKLLICMLTTGAPPRATACSASDTSYGDVTWTQWDAQRQNSKSLQHKPLPRPPPPSVSLAFVFPRRMECKGVYQVRRSNHQYAQLQTPTHARLKGWKDGERLAAAVFVPSGRSPAPVAGILHLAAGLADGAPAGAVSLNHVRAQPPTSLPGGPSFITLSVK